MRRVLGLDLGTNSIGWAVIDVGVLSIDEGLVAMLRDTRELLEKVAADLGEDVPSDAYVFSSDPLHRTPINPDTLRNRLPSIFSAS